MGAVGQHTAFEGHRRLLSGSLGEVALAVKRVLAERPEARILICDDATGRDFDIDTRGTEEEVIARLAPQAAAAEPPAEPRGRGRPRLGVVAREVTLLPRHWEWLSTQPGGASVALRKLVEEARQDRGGQDRKRQARDAAYHFMSAMAGDFPGFEEAARALYTNDRPRFLRQVDGWPLDVRAHALQLLAAGGDPVWL
jgi:hypothetical protein